MLKILHMASRRSQLAAGGLLAAAIREFGDLVICENGRELSDDQALAQMREADVLITMWGARAIPPALAGAPGRVRYILNLTGTCREFIPIEVIRSPIRVTNWGDAAAGCVAEGAMALLLAVLKDLRPRTEGSQAPKAGGGKRPVYPSGTLKGLSLGIYGCGFIGRRFVELAAPFGPKLLAYDPFANPIPASCHSVGSLDELFERSEAVAIHAGLTEATRRSVTARLLAKLPDHGIVINTARGDIVDQDALFAELKSGRLRAGLDVLADNDSLPADHEARTWPNLVLTHHDIAAARWPKRAPTLSESDQVALDNLKRFASGQPLRFEMDEYRYALST